MSWLSDQLASGTATLVEAAAEAMTYTRGNDTIPIMAIPQRKSHERFALADGRAQLEVQPADFSIVPTEIDFGDGPVEPQRGDIIEHDGETYEVTPRDGEACFRTDGYTLRVRTIQFEVI